MHTAAMNRVSGRKVAASSLPGDDGSAGLGGRFDAFEKKMSAMDRELKEYKEMLRRINPPTHGNAIAPPSWRQQRKPKRGSTRALLGAGAFLVASASLLVALGAHHQGYLDGPEYASRRHLREVDKLYQDFVQEPSYPHYELDDQVIFYHVFVPPGEDLNYTLGIVQEQLGQIGNSSSQSTIYYNTIGQPLVAALIDSICQATKLKCIFKKHYESAFEKVTLREVKRFCASQNPNMTVSYMHDKGSYHQAPENDHLRRSMTSAITSNECRSALRDNTCDTCGLLFEAMRFPFYPGNFFTAQCGYVNKLLDPFDFEEESNKVVRDALFMYGHMQLGFSLFPVMPSTLGLDRYAAEAWLGSHPTIRPCDVAKTGFNTFTNHTANPAEDFALEKAPRHKMNDCLKVPVPLSYWRRKKEYFLLGGKLLRWYHFYNAPPPPDSWAWSYFPDNKMWRRAVDQHGKQATKEVTNKFLYS